MGKLILLNDVLTELDEVLLLAGDTDSLDSATGKQQADVISSFFHEKIPNVDLVFSSDARRIKKLVHRIRVWMKKVQGAGIHIILVEGNHDKHAKDADGVYLFADLMPKKNIIAHFNSSS